MRDAVAVEVGSKSEASRQPIHFNRSRPIEERKERGHLLPFPPISRVVPAVGFPFYALAVISHLHFSHLHTMNCSSTHTHSSKAWIRITTHATYRNRNSSIQRGRLGFAPVAVGGPGRHPPSASCSRLAALGMSSILLLGILCIRTPCTMWYPSLKQLSRLQARCIDRHSQPVLASKFSLRLRVTVRGWQ
ncbi:uncharacterized protein LY79DRAFT_559924 [Colletotrichum navitas]|uniref:Uncharacterized protein n=1 Tax=Colletotrichum navitas TaxID=681940 RepID=A0AAD8PUQ2_9PEZI|nr:uncharacterized protein LY79DRAFT_559924 [Colletotrichum navitas]KAK1584966.1 hypothetical protein LY79DRAFT_559924 [Colletotrichum navitas]